MSASASVGIHDEPQCGWYSRKMYMSGGYLVYQRPGTKKTVRVTIVTACRNGDPYKGRAEDVTAVGPLGNWVKTVPPSRPLEDLAETYPLEDMAREWTGEWACTGEWEGGCHPNGMWR